MVSGIDPHVEKSMNDAFDGFCAVCFSPLDEATKLGDRRAVSCPRCGKYEITRTAEQQARRCLDVETCPHTPEEACLGPAIASGRGRKRANASAWLWHNPGTSVSTRDLPALSAIRSPLVSERADLLLRALAKASSSLGDPVSVTYKEWLARTWSLNDDEVDQLLSYLTSEGWLGRSNVLGPGDRVWLTIPGWVRFESAARETSEHEQGFVAMWFRPSLKRLYDTAIAPAIEAAGYKPHRVDSREFVGRIDDEIIAQIRRSRFLVADFTGHRGGVYWEAGFAFGLGIPVFFTCCRRHIAALHFDIRQYNTIDWLSRQDLARRLHVRIEAELGRGPSA